MTLGPEVRAFIEKSEAYYGPDAVDHSIATQRDMYDRYAALFTMGRPQGVTSEDLLLPGPEGPVPVRLYRKQESTETASILYLHGGGFILGGLDSHDFITARLCGDTGCPVIAVDYRLAPEHVFPAAFDDCYGVLACLQAHADEFAIDAAKIIAVGDSAGGTLAAGVALANRDRGGVPLLGQILIYPALGSDMTARSFTDEANAPMLTTQEVKYYNNVYMPNGMAPGIYGAPLTATDLSGLPAALILPVEHDPLRDEGVLYHAALRAAGVDTDLHVGAGLVHGCIRAIETIPQVAEIYRLICRKIEALKNK